MSADLSTSISMRGNQEALAAMLKVLRSFETEKREQYRTQRNCGYLEGVSVTGASGTCRTERMTDEEIQAFAATAGGELSIGAGGPWGVFNFPGDVGLFEALADVAPDAAFVGQIDGFITGADVFHRAELADGVMQIAEYNIPDEEIPELYTADFKKKLSHAKFCKLFKVDRDDFDRDCYEEFIYEAGAEGFPSEMDYDTFLEFCDCAEIDEDKFEAAIEKVSELGVVDLDTFRDDIDREDYMEKRIYDPRTKTYSRPGGGNKCQGLTFVITGKVHVFKNRDAFAQYVELQGGKVSGSISKNTSYLVNNDIESNSSKNKKAKELGIPIITEDEFVAQYGS